MFTCRSCVHTTTLYHHWQPLRAVGVSGHSSRSFSNGIFLEMRGKNSRLFRFLMTRKSRRRVYLVPAGLFLFLYILIYWHLQPKHEKPFVNVLGNRSVLKRIIDKYNGVELFSDRLVIDPAEFVDGKTVPLNYQGFTVRVTVREAETELAVVEENQDYVLYVHRENGGNEKSVRIQFNLTLERETIFLTVKKRTMDHWSRVPYQLQTNFLPDPKYMHEVGNGHLATVINGPYVHMNGLYNGEGSKSRRAKIPSLVGFEIRTNHTAGQLEEEIYVLDVRQGIFKESKVYRNPSLVVTREIFAHRDNDRILAVQSSIWRPLSETTPSVPSPGDHEAVAIWIEGLPNEEQLESLDIVFEPTVAKQFDNNNATYKSALGRIKTPEVQGSKPHSTVCVAWYSDFRWVVIKGGDFNVTVMTSYVAIGVGFLDASMALTQAISQPFHTFRVQHVAKWNTFWDNGFIYVDPNENFQLAQTLWTSFYYILSSLPTDQDPGNPFAGLSRSGLARGADRKDYSGHSFWDTELWMFPGILPFVPAQSRLLLESRLSKLDEAQRNAQNAGSQGAKFPWEVASSGLEVSPWSQAAELEIHVTADVAFAIRQYLYVIDDKVEAVKELNLEVIAVEIAKYWQSRTTCDSSGKCGILGVMPPDEYHFPVNNSVYTNYAASLALKLPEYIFNLTGGSHPDLVNWSDTANRLTYPRSTTEDGREFYLEFEGFTPGKWHYTSKRLEPGIKHADVMLLDYPLMMPMSDEIRQTNLEVYRAITDENGPAMTWTMFTIGYLSVGNIQEADALFTKNYDHMVQPFNVWSEFSHGQGAVNFLTGMGGFLQAVINGYGGIRLKSNHIMINPNRLPQTTKWKLTGFKYLGYQLDISFNFEENIMSFETKTVQSNSHLVLELKTGRVHHLAEVGQITSVPVGMAVLRIARQNDTVNLPLSAENIPAAVLS